MGSQIECCQYVVSAMLIASVLRSVNGNREPSMHSYRPTVRAPLPQRACMFAVRACLTLLKCVINTQRQAKIRFFPRPKLSAQRPMWLTVLEWCGWRERMRARNESNFERVFVWLDFWLSLIKPSAFTHPISTDVSWRTNKIIGCGNILHWDSNCFTQPGERSRSVVGIVKCASEFGYGSAFYHCHCLHVMCWANPIIPYAPHWRYVPLCGERQKLLLFILWLNLTAHTSWALHELCSTHTKVHTR